MINIDYELILADNTYKIRNYKNKSISHISNNLWRYIYLDKFV